MRHLFRPPTYDRSIVIQLIVGLFMVWAGLAHWGNDGVEVFVVIGIMQLFGGAAEWLPLKNTIVPGILRILSICCAILVIFLLSQW